MLADSLVSKDGYKEAELTHQKAGQEAWKRFKVQIHSWADWADSRKS